MRVFRFQNILVSAHPEISIETHTGHEVSEQRILLVGDLRVEQMCVRLAVQNHHHFRIHSGEEREARRHVRTEHRRLVLLHLIPEELARSLEPEVVQPVRYRTHHRPPVRSRDGSERWVDGGGGRRNRRAWTWLGKRVCSAALINSFLANWSLRKQ
ncbi:hypothetical protein LINGRAHAP2_LOCUS28573 [Linum grandiflorum]